MFESVANVSNSVKIGMITIYYCCKKLHHDKAFYSVVEFLLNSKIEALAIVSKGFVLSVDIIHLFCCPIVYHNKPARKFDLYGVGVYGSPRQAAGLHLFQRGCF